MCTARTYYARVTGRSGCGSLIVAIDGRKLAYCANANGVSDRLYIDTLPFLWPPYPIWRAMLQLVSYRSVANVAKRIGCKR